MANSKRELVAPPKRRVFQDIVEFLTAEIERGRLRPGDRLKPERELAKELGVSRGSLREAIKALEMLDAVELRHGQGVFVTVPQPHVLSTVFGTLLSMQPGQSDDIVDARIALECHSARLACRNAGARDHNRMRRALEDMILQTAEGTGADGALSDHEFHSAIVESTGNPMLIFLYTAITGVLKRAHHESWLSLFSTKEYWQQLNDAHASILEAIVARDEDRAAQAVVEHFELITRFQEQHKRRGNSEVASIAFRPRRKREASRANTKTKK